jgi:voltage-gated potassium channel Kch
VHGLIEALHPDSYRTDGLALSARSDAMVLATFQYFSTITLTTVGFGDIVPVTPAARLVTGFGGDGGPALLGGRDRDARGAGRRPASVTPPS